MINLHLPEDVNKFTSLKVGDEVLISGTIYTARDCAHKRLKQMIDNGESLPFELKNATIYYAGPCPAPEGRASGSCGPTTAARVDVFTPQLLDNGLKGMIGKGGRNDAVVDSCVKNKAVYFVGIGGAGALYGLAVKESKLIAFPDLLSEAIYKFTVKDFPVIVAVDTYGNTIYKK